MDRKQFEEWFKSTNSYAILEDSNIWKVDLFAFYEPTNSYLHSGVCIAFETWQYRCTRTVELEAAVDSLSDENAHFRNKKWDQNEDFTRLQAKVEELQKRIDTALNEIKSALRCVESIETECVLREIEQALKGEGQ